MHHLVDALRQSMQNRIGRNEKVFWTGEFRLCFRTLTADSELDAEDQHRIA